MPKNKFEQICSFRFEYVLCVIRIANRQNARNVAGEDALILFLTQPLPMSIKAIGTASGEPIGVLAVLALRGWANGWRIIQFLLLR